MPPLTLSVPVGAYHWADVSAPCGLSSATSLIGILDDPGSFHHARRFEAALVWFQDGFLEYSFAPPAGILRQPVAVEFEAEVCADAPQHDLTWPSDITVWINGVEIATWCCPSDYGGTRGRLTPDWWHIDDSQHGVLVRWSVDGSGATVAQTRRAGPRIADLGIDAGSAEVTVRLGVKRNARHRGGINLFGRAFGNHPQDPTLRLFTE